MEHLPRLEVTVVGWWQTVYGVSMVSRIKISLTLKQRWKIIVFFQRCMIVMRVTIVRTSKRISHTMQNTCLVSAKFSPNKKYAYPMKQNLSNNPAKAYDSRFGGMWYLLHGRDDLVMISYDWRERHCSFGLFSWVSSRRDGVKMWA